MSYNGWHNYETWNVALWLDNEESSQEYWNERAREVWDTSVADNILTREQRARYDLADELKREHEENIPDFRASVWTDLLNAALSEVNWSEIAEHYLDSAREDEVVA